MYDSLKGLNQFLDIERFLDGKTFQVTACREWQEYETKKHLGTSVEVVIVSDNTQYRPNSKGETFNNLYVKLKFKTPRDVSVPAGAFVVPVDAVGTVYGQRNNQLSIKCADVKVVQPSKE